ncbi:hypothetical protein C8R48DRAFT_610440 [Suillus tomentosus]|nr:hypothetical protein C8R48DRAFT_610440 [Suillus tomentosus]
MKNDIYLTIHLNARAVKTRIRDRLRQRKFELERLERSFARTPKPAILKLVSTYNDLCTQLQSLIHQRRAPPSAIPPHPIAREGIFLLDVDDEIWQDIGLDNDDHCVEEETHLMREWSVMQEWIPNDLVMPFHLRARAEELLSICVVWKNKVREIPCAWPVKHWGPTNEDLL